MYHKKTPFLKTDNAHRAESPCYISSSDATSGKGLCQGLEHKKIPKNFLRILLTCSKDMGTMRKSIREKRLCLFAIGRDNSIYGRYPCFGKKQGLFSLMLSASLPLSLLRVNIISKNFSVFFSVLGLDADLFQR
jgi:hypothetical protein